MSLEHWEIVQRQKGNLAGAEMARVLREQYGDVDPLEPHEGGIKLPSEPEILYPRRKDVVSRFVKRAIQEGARLRKPIVYGLNEEGWIRGRNILGSYLLSSATQADIGRVYCIAQITVKEGLNRSIGYLWLSASPELQEQFILPHGPVTREVTPKKTPEKRSPETKGLHKTTIKLTAYKPAVLPSESNPIHPRLKVALSGVNFTFIDPVSRELIKQALTEGAHTITPPGMNSERWINYRNIFGTYILSHASLDKIGKIYGISRERVRQINKEVLEKLFPENKISLKKAPQYRPKEWLLVKDNLGTEIVEFLEQGLSTDQILSRFDTGPLRKQAINALKLLREAGFDITRIKSIRGEHLRIEQELLREDLADEEIQSLLDQIDSIGSIHFFFHSREAIIPIRELLFSIGFHYRVDKGAPFYDALIDAGIPLGMTEYTVQSGPQKGKRYYYFIAAQHRQRAEEVLKANPALARFLENPVKQVSGPDTQIPTTTLIINKRGIVSIRSILNEFGIPSSSRGEKIKKIEEALKTSNQLSLFEYQGKAYTLEADIQKVRAFIKAKLEEVRNFS